MSSHDGWPPVAAAYGLRVAGIAAGGALALRGAESWPVITVRRVVSQEPPPAVGSMSAAHATILTPAGALLVDRASATLTVRGSAPVDDADLVHPALWPAASVFARWSGRETLHAGAFVGPDGGAWGVLGESGGGKSSLLADLALRGVEVLVDDLIVLDGDDCCAGPRCIDLRPETVASLRLGDDRTRAVRSTSRRRLALAPCAASRPLAGFVELTWGEEVAVSRVAPSSAFAMLARHRRVIGLGAEYGDLLGLLDHPVLRLARPRDWNRREETVEALMRAIGERSS